MSEKMTPNTIEGKVKRPTPGEIREFNGRKFRWTDSGYTIRQYFSHSTPEKGPGPGWDSRFALANPERALEECGRTFTIAEVANPSKFPDTPYYEWQLITSE